MEKEQVPSYDIHEPRLEDVPSIRAMHRDSWLAAYPNDEYDVSYEWVKDWVDTWLLPEKLKESEEIVKGIIDDSTQFHRIATLGERIVGFIHILTNEDGTKELEAIYTHPDTFSTGLGSQLLQEADKWINGAETQLTVVVYNDRAIKFYEKHGFVKKEGSESVYADKLPTIRMIRKGKNDEV